MLEKLDYYTLYVKSPFAFSNPDKAYSMKIEATGKYTDLSQKNFEILVQSIGLRIMPVLMDRPLPVQDLKLVGAPTLEGEGYVCTFSVAKEKTTCEDFINALDKIVLHNTDVIRATGQSKNVEVIKDRNKKLAWWRHFLKRV